MVLTCIKKDNICRIKKVDGGGHASKRLYELGLNSGARVKVVKNDIGPVIVSVSGQKLAIGRSLADKIEIDEE